MNTASGSFSDVESIQKKGTSIKKPVMLSTRCRAALLNIDRTLRFRLTIVLPPQPVSWTIRNEPIYLST